MPIRPEDNSLHDPGTDPYWNESAFFAVLIPELNIDGFVYIWHRPNMRLSAGGLALWNEVGSNSHDCLYHDFNYIQAMPAGADMFDFALEGGLSMSCLKPLESYLLRYQGDGCEAELRWDAVMDPQPLHFAENEGAQSWGNGHFEQAGRLAGSILLEGQTLAVDCLSIRDQSWGPRPYNAGLRSSGGFEWGYASESSGFSVTSMREGPLGSQPFTGTTETMRYGFYTKDGVTSPVGRGTRRVIERRAEDGRPVRLEIDAVDDLGRRLEAQGTCSNALHYHGLWFCYWGLARWEFDGNVGWGETQDFFSPHQMRRFQQAMLRQGGGAVR